MFSIKRILSSKIFLFLMLLAVIWLGLVSVRTYYKKYQLDEEIDSLKAEISKLDKSGAELSQMIKYFENKSFLEQEAKEKLNLKKEGENVMMVPEAAISQSSLTQEASSTPALAQNTEKKVEENNLIKWWRYLFER